MAEERRVTQKRYLDKLKETDPDFMTREAERKRLERKKNKLDLSDDEKKRRNNMAKMRNRKCRMKKKWAKVNKGRMKRDEPSLSFEDFLKFYGLTLENPEDETKGDAPHGQREMPEMPDLPVEPPSNVRRSARKKAEAAAGAAATASSGGPTPSTSSRPYVPFVTMAAEDRIEDEKATIIKNWVQKENDKESQEEEH